MTTYRRTAFLAVFSALACVLIGCSTTPGQDTLGDAGDAAPFPPRPASVQVDRIEPCSALSASQQAQLDINASEPGDATVDGRRSPGCGYLSTTGFDYNTQTIPIGAEAALRAAGAETLQVNGFGAVRDFPADSFSPRPICQVAIDAAPGQTIRVQVSPTPNRPQPSKDELCRRATEVASMVMTTVVATASR